MRSFRLVLAVLLGPSLGACGFSTPASEATGDDVQPAIDAGRDAPIIPDGPDGSTSACIAAATTCNADVLTTCSAAGAQPTVETCAWGCVSTGSAHCGHLQPSGAAVMAGDLDAVGATGAIDLAGTIDTMTGAIANLRQPGTGVVSGIGFAVRGTVGVFTFESVHVTGPLAVNGPNALAIIARGDVTIDAAIDVSSTGQEPGPGGRKGGNKGMTSTGSGGGTGGTGPHDNCSGGGGGGFGGAGGDGGKSAGTTNSAAGPVFGSDAISTLSGGGGGGGGGAPSGGPGGGGGGAVQISCNGTLRINASGAIDAGGGGGRGSTDDGGGGGGAGGAVLLEAPSIIIAGQLAANGGGGGGSDGGAAGQPGQLSRARAVGGTGLAAGGRGTAANIIGGEGGANAKNAAGGGGGAGRIRISTRSGTAMITGMLSPDVTDVPTTATVGSAAIQ